MRDSEVPEYCRCTYRLLLALIITGLVPVTIAQFQVHPASDGSYTISVDGKTWLHSADTYFRHSNTTFTTATKTLGLTGPPTSAGGIDGIGEFTMTNYSYQAKGKRVDAYIKDYKAGNVLIFSQLFCTDFSSAATKDKDLVVSSFPSVVVGQSDLQLGYVSYNGVFSGWSDLRIQKWTKSCRLDGGMGSGPLVLFDSGNNVLIISPFNQFMAASMWHDEPSQALHWGIMGAVPDIPQDYLYETIVFYSNKGINKAMRAWGKLMQEQYGRTSSFRDADLSINYIGYYTDNGAYYYHFREPKMNYEQTMLAIQNYYKKANIPYRYLQYDDWFYPTTGTGYGATVTWDAAPWVFPHGLRYLYNVTEQPVVAHNRYWSSKTTYAKQNGGRFNFYMDGENSIPDDQSFWDYLFSTSKQWGLYVYEQDWLNFQSSTLRPLYADLTRGRRWLMQMGEAAERNGLPLQYCMAYPRHLLAALEIPAVTQIRVSIDYQLRWYQYKIGVSSLFADSLGVAPFKDNFWTKSVQPGNKYNKTEPCPALNAAIALLSTGPVGPSDRVGYSDTALINSLITADGRLLKPSIAATAIDAQMKQLVYGGDTGPKGEVWTTHSYISGFTFGVILATDLTATYNLKLSQTGFDTGATQFVFGGQYSPSKAPPQRFDDDHPLALAGCVPHVLCLYYTSPVFSIHGDQVIILGEVGKMVPLSPVRISAITTTTNDLQLTLKGTPGEQLQIEMCNAVKSTECWHYDCVISGNGHAVLSAARHTCH